MNLNRTPPTYAQNKEAFNRLGGEQTIKELEDQYNKLRAVQEHLGRYLEDMYQDIQVRKGVEQVVTPVQHPTEGL